MNVYQTSEVFRYNNVGVRGHAYFKTQGQLTVLTNVSPFGSGLASGGGVYSSGTTCTLTAVANQGYVFSHWTNQAGTAVSFNPQYAFLVDEDDVYTAHFILEGDSSDEPDDSSDEPEYEDGPLLYDPSTGRLLYSPTTGQLRYLRRRIAN